VDLQFCIVPGRDHTSKELRYGSRSQGISQFYLHTRIHPPTKWTIPAFAFPAKAGTHLPTPEGWEAELALCNTDASCFLECVRYQWLGKVCRRGGGKTDIRSKGQMH